MVGLKNDIGSAVKIAKEHVWQEKSKDLGIVVDNNKKLVKLEKLLE